MSGHFSSNKTVALSFFIHCSPLLTKLIRILRSFDFSFANFSMIPFAPASGSLSYSTSDFIWTLFILFHHFTLRIWPFTFDLSKRFRSASVSHSLFYKRAIESFLFKNLFELFHAFIFFISSSISFQSVFLSESMFLSFDLLIGFLDLLWNFRFKILLNFHSFHFQKQIFLFFKLIKSFPNIRINKICDIFTVINLWYNVILPLLRDNVVLL